MEKRKLKKIAKEWAAGILYHGTGTNSFDDNILSEEEQGYIVDEVFEIALKIIKNLDIDRPESNLEDIIKKHYGSK